MPSCSAASFWASSFVTIVKKVEIFDSLTYIISLPVGNVFTSYGVISETLVGVTVGSLVDSTVAVGVGSTAEPHSHSWPLKEAVANISPVF